MPPFLRKYFKALLGKLYLTVYLMEPYLLAMSFFVFLEGQGTRRVQAGCRVRISGVDKRRAQGRQAPKQYTYSHSHGVKHSQSNASTHCFKWFSLNWNKKEVVSMKVISIILPAARIFFYISCQSGRRTSSLAVKIGPMSSTVICSYR